MRTWPPCVQPSPRCARLWQPCARPYHRHSLSRRSRRALARVPECARPHRLLKPARTALTEGKFSQLNYELAVSVLQLLGVTLSHLRRASSARSLPVFAKRCSTRTASKAGRSSSSQSEAIAATRAAEQRRGSLSVRTSPAPGASSGAMGKSKGVGSDSYPLSKSKRGRRAARRGWRRRLG